MFEPQMRTIKYMLNFENTFNDAITKTQNGSKVFINSILTYIWCEKSQLWKVWQLQQPYQLYKHYTNMAWEKKIHIYTHKNNAWLVALVLLKSIRVWSCHENNGQCCKIWQTGWGRLYVGNYLFRVLSWQLKQVGDDITDWELLYVSGLSAGFGDTRLAVLLLSEFIWITVHTNNHW